MQAVDEAMLLDVRAREVFMPALSSTMTEGKIVQWLKKPGDKVESGDIVMVVESDKADMDVECFESGYIASLLVPEGGMAAVGSTVALIAEKKEDIDKIAAHGLEAIVSGSGSRHDGTTAVLTPVTPPTPEPVELPKPQCAEIFMPALSSTMTEGKVVQWLKKEGDKIEAGDMVMIVESDKADMDVESFESGYLAAIVTQQGQMGGVGDAVAYIAPTKDAIAGVKAWAQSLSGVAAAAPTPAPPQAKLEVPRPAPVPIGSKVVNTGRIVASPYAKKVASEMGVDLSYVQGTGPNGRIQAEDVTNAVSSGAPKAAVPAPAAAAAAPAPRRDGKVVATPEAVKVAQAENIKLETVTGTGNFGRITAEDVLRAAGKAPVKKAATTVAAVAAAPSAAAKPAAEKAAAPAVGSAGVVPMNGLQRTVVKNMNASLSVPVFRVSYNIKTTALDALYAKIKGKGVTVSALLAKACAQVLLKHPILNAAYANDSIVYAEHVSIAMAVATPDGGLITPVLKDADKADIYSLSRTWKDLVKRTMEKKLSPGEYSGANFYISNLGMFGVESFDAVLPPGAGSILAVAGSKPMVGVGKNGLIQVEKIMNVNITCDHRIIYGAQAAEFLKDLCDLLENRVEELLL